MEEWRNGGLEDWRIGGLEDWRIGEVERWRGGEVERWRGGVNFLSFRARVPSEGRFRRPTSRLPPFLHAFGLS